MKIYQVGGAVRDKLLGLPVKDRDWVVVGATVQHMLDLGYQQVGRDFPVFLHPDSKEEYALARTERKSGSGHTGFAVHADPNVTLEQDLLRRDLTINAIAMDSNGELTDPYNGLSDIKKRQLRHVSPAFSEDPLRVLRVARFAARFADIGFTVANDTMSLMQDISHSGELEHLSAERLWVELHKALLTDAPRRCIEVLKESGALTVLLPELAALFGVPQPKQYHPEIDTGLHTLMALDSATRLSGDPVIRFAALVHDLGKGNTDPGLWPSHKGHEERGVALIKQLSERLCVPNEYRELGELVSRCHTRCHRAPKHDAEELFHTLELTDALRRPERFEQFLIACEADARGRAGLENREYLQPAILQAALLSAKQCDIQTLVKQGLKGPVLGEAIRASRIQAIQNFMDSADHHNEQQ